MTKLSTYYKIYKLIGTGKKMRCMLDVARLVKMRYLVVRFDPNWLCNLRCPMCYFSSDKYRGKLIKPMSTELFDRIAADLFPRARILFLGCGAEPLMSPEFTKYLDTISRYKIPHVTIVSNGQLLSEKIVIGMIKNEIDEIIISMDGISPETYEYIRAGGNLKLLLNNLRMLKKIKSKNNSAKPVLRINFTMMKRNYRELEDIINASSEFGITTIRLRALSHWGGALDYQNEILSKEFYFNIAQKTNELAEKKSVELIYKGKYDSHSKKTDSIIDGSSEKNSSTCMFPWYTIQVRGDGKIRFLTYFNYGMGDLSKQSFKEFLQSKVVKEIKSNLRKNPDNSCLKKCKGHFGGI